MDNTGNSADLVVTGIHWWDRWQPDSHTDRGGCDHLDLQPGLWPAICLSAHLAGKTLGG